jgi:hypothetical protein
MAGSRRVLLTLAGVALAVGSIVAAPLTPEQRVQAAGTVLLHLFRSSPATVRTLFVKQVTNPYFPLERGTTFFYEGAKGGVPTSDQVHVTDRVVRILNVDCTVVRDKAFENGVLVEDTLDFYAQDVSGTVWYFGEDTKELDESGHVTSTEGSWRAGVNGAAPGIIMLAHPHVGDVYYQELAAGVGEDTAVVRSLTASHCVPFDCFDHLLKTTETNRLEPAATDNKYYARGVGFVREVATSGESEHSELVRITHE